MFDATSTFVGVVGGIAMSFGAMWCWYFLEDPRERAESGKRSTALDAGNTKEPRPSLVTMSGHGRGVL